MPLAMLPALTLTLPLALALQLALDKLWVSRRACSPARPTR